MSENEEYIGILKIDPSLYKKRFGLENRGTESFLYDEQSPFFSEEERLTSFEIGEIEKWGPYIVDLLSARGTSKIQKRFHDCARGQEVPKSANEQIIVKLVHQALAMGGLYSSPEQESSNSFISVDKFPANDIDEISLTILCDLLRGIRAEMSLRTCKKIQQYWRRLDDGFPDAEDGYHDDEMSVIADDLASDSDDFARSGEDGWFYDDKDD